MKITTKTIAGVLNRGFSQNFNLLEGNFLTSVDWEVEIEA